MEKSVRFVFMFNLAHVHFRATIRVCWKACMHAIMYVSMHVCIDDDDYDVIVMMIYNVLE